MLCNIDDEPGGGNFAAACLDLMTLPPAASGRKEHGLFARIYYPTDGAIPDEKRRYAKWIQRDEYLMGAAQYGYQFEQVHHCDGTERSACRCPRPARLGGASAWCAKNAMSHLLGLARCQSPALWAAALTKAAPAHLPVVVFSHGLASCRLYHSAMCSRLAKRGYVVLALEHADRSAAWTYRIDESGKEEPINLKVLENTEDDYPLRNRQVHKRALVPLLDPGIYMVLNCPLDCLSGLQALEQLNAKGDFGHKLVLGAEFDWMQFKGRLDLSKPMVAGHSFGAITALTALAMGSGFRSAVALDGWMFPCDHDLHDKLATANAHVLFINSHKWQWKENKQKMAKVLAACGQNGQSVTIKDTTHLNYCDWSHAVRWRWMVQRLGFGGPVDPSACDRLCTMFMHKLYDKGMGVDIDAQSSSCSEGSLGWVKTVTSTDEEKKLIITDDIIMVLDSSCNEKISAVSAAL